MLNKILLLLFLQCLSTDTFSQYTLLDFFDKGEHLFNHHSIVEGDDVQSEKGVYVLTFLEGHRIIILDAIQKRKINIGNLVYHSSEKHTDGSFRINFIGYDVDEHTKVELIISIVTDIESLKIRERIKDFIFLFHFVDNDFSLGFYNK